MKKEGKYFLIYNSVNTDIFVLSSFNIQQSSFSLWNISFFPVQ